MLPSLLQRIITKSLVNRLRVDGDCSIERIHVKSLRPSPEHSLHDSVRIVNGNVGWDQLICFLCPRDNSGDVLSDKFQITGIGFYYLNVL